MRRRFVNPKKRRARNRLPSNPPRLAFKPLLNLMGRIVLLSQGKSLMEKPGYQFLRLPSNSFFHALFGSRSKKNSHGAQCGKIVKASGALRDTAGYFQELPQPR
jgi:hypothetical protein